MFILDSHCDTPSEILRGRDLSKDNSKGHVDFPKLKRGGVDGVFFALYIPASMDADPSEALQHAKNLLNGVKNALSEVSENLIFAKDRASAHKNKAEGKVSIFLGLENGSPLSPNVDWKSILQYFFDEGVRYVTLCHSEHNAICDSCAPDSPKWNGLSPFGREVIAEMNRLGILVDVSHISDDAFYDVLKFSSRPVVATHSCCRALCNHPRNMSDDMIKALASNGGVIQINFYPVFLETSYDFEIIDNQLIEKGERPSYKVIADHIDHVVSLVGIDYVGIGSDYDGIDVAPRGMEDISMMPKLFNELRNRGYSETDLNKIASENFFRILK